MATGFKKTYAFLLLVLLAVVVCGCSRTAGTSESEHTSLKPFIVLGMAEGQAGRFFNTGVLLGPNGVKGVYRRKMPEKRDSWRI